MQQFFKDQKTEDGEQRTEDGKQRAGNQDLVEEDLGLLNTALSRIAKRTTAETVCTHCGSIQCGFVTTSEPNHLAR